MICDFVWSDGYVDRRQVGEQIPLFVEQFSNDRECRRGTATFENETFQSGTSMPVRPISTFQRVMLSTQDIIYVEVSK